jgi:hypothetical protein
VHISKKFLAGPAVLAVLAFGAIGLTTATASTPARAAQSHRFLPAPWLPFYNSGVLYNSLVPAGIYSEAFNGAEITEFGNAVNLAAYPTGAPLGAVTVGMANFGPSAFTTPVTFTIYNIATGGVVGSEIATLQENVAVPNNDNAGGGVSTFNAVFNFAPRHVVLPGVVVYGITRNGLINDCATTSADCGNDPNPVGSLNVDLNSNVSVGSDVYPGDIYASSLQADFTGNALAVDLGACPGAPTGVLTPFQGVPVGCAGGYGSDIDGLGIDAIPAVEFSTIP